jgi:hypothetical protein
VAVLQTDQILTTQQLADRIGYRADTVASWRRAGRGPEFIRLGYNVFYTVEAVERWERETGRQSAWPSTSWSVSQPPTKASLSTLRTRRSLLAWLP